MILAQKVITGSLLLAVLLAYGQTSYALDNRKWVEAEAILNAQAPSICPEHFKRIPLKARENRCDVACTTLQDRVASGLYRRVPKPCRDYIEVSAGCQRGPACQ